MPLIVLNSDKNPIGALSTGRGSFKDLKYQIIDQNENQVVLELNR